MAFGSRKHISWWRRATDAALGFIVVRLMRGVRLIDVGIMANVAGRLMRWVGPWLPEHKTGRANLAAAYPDKSPAEVEHILSGVWDNLGRVGVEFAHIDRLWDLERMQGRGRILPSDESQKIAMRLRDDGKPALLFAAHLANWELAAVGAHTISPDGTIVYRRPSMHAVADEVVALREGCMGTLIPTNMQAPLRLAEALQRGSHVGMLVDQFTTGGVPVTFFGRRTRANALIARLARQIECPIHGVRVVRYPGDRFQVSITEAIEPPRNADGRIDVEGTMQAITDVVEGWVREHPEQWLWLHSRWRDY